MANHTAHIQDLLTGANQLNTKDLGVFFHQVHQLLSKRKLPTLPEQEASLLLKIQESIPLQWLERAAALHEKRQDGLLTATENEELLRITEEIESRHIQRLELLIELAQYRGIALKTLMEELGIVPYAAHG